MKWTLFDYGVGNLHSLRKALAAVGADTEIVDDPTALRDADILVLPGVGAFGHVMERLKPATDDLRARHKEGRPIFGVCIGQQVLYDASDEAPGIPGLGILQGNVERLPAQAGKIPHMGWSPLASAEPGLPDGAHVYYVHSYAAAPGETTLATSTYGVPFAAAVRDHNTLAFQFHPEKSSQVGQRILTYARAEMEKQA